LDPDYDRFRMEVGGRSDAPPGPYSTRQLAVDAVAVLDALGIERAHVFGVSMGGMIAQELALGFPERVDRLVLGSTQASTQAAVRPRRDVSLAFAFESRRLRRRPPACRPRARRHGRRARAARRGDRERAPESHKYCGNYDFGS
jgi:pimeloyl-ACP methyl ester carboxylesterase